MAGVDWVPGAAQYVTDRSGCHTEQAATLHTSSNALANELAAGIEQENLDKYGIKTITATKIKVSGSDVNLSINGYYDCLSNGDSQVSQSSTQPATSNDRVNAQTDAKWPKIVLAALASTAVFFSVTLIVEVVFAPLIPVGATAAVLLAASAVEGCIGGSAAAAVAQAIFGYSDWKTVLTAEVLGCFTGATAGLLWPKYITANQAGASISRAIESEIGGGAGTVGGQALVDVAGGAELTTVSDVVTTTTGALETVR